MQPADPGKVQGDIAKAQADGQKVIVDAQAKLDQLNALTNKNVVDAQVDARATNASNAMVAATQNADAAAALTHSNEKIADAQYAVDMAKAEAASNVAQAQCEAQTGNAAKVCRVTAKTTYDADIGVAKSKSDAAHSHSPGNG